MNSAQDDLVYHLRSYLRGLDVNGRFKMKPKNQTAARVPGDVS